MEQTEQGLSCGGMKDESEKEIYRLLEKSFQERDFGMWVQCSKAL